MLFSDATNEAEFIESIRSIFRAYVPESDAWAKPNMFDINSTVIGGLSWSSVNEARNGVNARMNPQTAVGEFLDVIAAQPPLNLRRLTPTQAVGFIEVDFPTLTDIPQGFEFTNQAGTVFTVDALSPSVGLVPVTSTEYGSGVNSPDNQPVNSAEGEARSRGVYGGADTECDEQLRRRIYAKRSSFHFFGSACSYETAMLGFAGVTRSWAVDCDGSQKLLFLMEDKYHCGVPLQTDIDAITVYFEDECLANMYFCPLFEPAVSLKLAPSISWGVEPDDYCELEEAIQLWLRGTHDLGQNVIVSDLQCYLNDSWPELQGKVNCCGEYIAQCNEIYNCVELIHGCG